MNTNALQNLVEDVRDEHNLDVFWDKISFALAPYGVTSMFYGAIASKAEAQQGTRTKNLVYRCDHTHEFTDYFGMDKLVDDCKSFEHILKETTPFIWHDANNWNDSRPEQWEQAQIEREMGLYLGFTLPTTLFDENSYGAHGICMGELIPGEFDKLWADKKQEIFSILSIMHTGMRQNHIGQVVKLSPREKEVLEWLASGINPQQIADRLNIGYRTVDKYIVSAKQKLKARTRDHAVAKALMFNIINP
jgi:DNA-binding CsgD family transcriptional regulator